jgi:hypothetical protein
MRILGARLETAVASGPALERFYRDELGLPAADSSLPYAFRAGTTVLEFEPVDAGRPFYHFALRVPRNRFAAAREWLASQVELLPAADSGETTFRFEAWNADACRRRASGTAPSARASSSACAS